MTCDMCHREMRTRHEPADGVRPLNLNGTRCRPCHDRIRQGRTGPSGRKLPATEVIAEAEWLADSRETLERVAERLGYDRVGSFVRVLERAGRYDLLARFPRWLDVAS